MMKSHIRIISPNNRSISQKNVQAFYIQKRYTVDASCVIAVNEANQNNTT